MGSINMAGMGTGLDIHGMAQIQAQAQLQPQAEALTKEEAEIDAEIAALEELSTALNDFALTLARVSNPENFGAMAVSMSEADAGYLDVTVDEDAVPNIYEVEVDELAMQHKLQIAEGDSETGAVTPGVYTLEVNGETMTYEVVDGANSYDQVATDINDHPDNPGVVAGVVNDGSTSHLTLTSEETGIENSIRIYEGTTADPTNELTGNNTPGFEELQLANDAVFSIDGIEMTSPTNTIDSAIDGVTFELNEVTNGPVTVNIAPDTELMVAAINDVVDAFNDVMTTIDSLQESYPSEEDEDIMIRGPLASDSMTATIERELRAAMFMTVDGTYSNVIEIGITSSSDGTLEVDDEILTAAIEEDPNAVSDMFLAEDAIIDSLEDVTQTYIGRAEEPEEEDEEDTGEEDDEEVDTVSSKSASADTTEYESEEYVPSEGLIDERITGLEEDQREIDDEWDELEERYDDIYERYLNEYLAMDLAVAEMNQSMMYLM